MSRRDSTLWGANAAILAPIMAPMLCPTRWTFPQFRWSYPTELAIEHISSFFFSFSKYTGVKDSQYLILMGKCMSWPPAEAQDNTVWTDGTSVMIIEIATSWPPAEAQDNTVWTDGTSVMIIEIATSNSTMHCHISILHSMLYDTGISKTGFYQEANDISGHDWSCVGLLCLWRSRPPNTSIVQ